MATTERPGGTRRRGLRWIAFATSAITGLTSCSSRERAPKRDVAVLERILDLPVRPSEAWYGSIPRGHGEGVGPDDLTFVAVMRFERAGIDRLVQAHGFKEEEPWLPAQEMPSWLPPAVKGALQPSGPKRVLVRGKCYEGQPLLRKPSPYATICILTDSPFVILLRPQDAP